MNSKPVTTAIQALSAWAMSWRDGNGEMSEEEVAANEQAAFNKLKAELN